MTQRGGLIGGDPAETLRDARQASDTDAYGHAAGKTDAARLASTEAGGLDKTTQGARRSY